MKTCDYLGGYHGMVTFGYAHKGDIPRKFALWLSVINAAIMFSARHLVYRFKVHGSYLLDGEHDGSKTWALKVKVLYKSLLSHHQ